jgi:hypothetical protein
MLPHSSLHLPDSCGGVEATSGEIPTIWRPGARTDGPVVGLLQGSLTEPAACGLVACPYPHCFVPATACQVFTCRRSMHTHGLLRWLMKSVEQTMPDGDHDIDQTRSIWPSNVCKC